MPSITEEKGTLKNQYLMLNDPLFSCKKTKLSPINICQSCNIEKTLIDNLSFTNFDGVDVIIKGFQEEA